MRFAVLVAASVLAGIGVPDAMLTPAHSQAQGQAQGVRAGTEEQMVRTWLKGIQSSEVNVQTGKFSFDPTSKALDIADLLITREVKRPTGTAQVRFKIARLQLTALTSDGAGTRASGVVARDLSVSASDAPENGIFLDQLTIGALSLPDLSSVIADPARPVTSHASYLRNLLRGSIAGVTATGLRVDKSLTVDKVEFGKVAGGRLESIELTGVNSPGATPDDSRFSLSRVALMGVDIDVYVQMFEAQSYRSTSGEQPWRPLASSLEINTLKMGFGRAADLGLAKFVAGPLKLRLFPEDLTPHLDKAAIDPTYFTNQKDAGTAVSTAIVDSVALDGVKLEGITLRSAGKDGPIDLALSDLSVAGLSARGIDDITASGLSVRDPNGSVGLGKASLGQLALPPPKDLANAGTALRAGQEVDRSKLGLTLGRLSLDALDVKTKDATFALGSLFFEFKYYIGQTPTNIKASLSRLKVPVAQIKDQGLSKLLDSLGYTELDASAELVGAWQEATKEIAVERAGVSAVGMGNLTLSGSLTGVDASAFEDPRQRLAEQMLAGGLRKARLTYRDDSLFGKAFGLFATQNKQTPEALRKVLSTNMPAIMGGIADPTTRNKFIFAAVAFLNDPKTLEIFSTSNTAIPIQEIQKGLMAPATLPAILKLDVSANKRN